MIVVVNVIPLSTGKGGWWFFLGTRTAADIENRCRLVADDTRNWFWGGGVVVFGDSHSLEKTRELEKAVFWSSGRERCVGRGLLEVMIVVFLYISLHGVLAWFTLAKCY